MFFCLYLPQRYVAGDWHGIKPVVAAAFAAEDGAAAAASSQAISNETDEADEGGTAGEADGGDDAGSEAGSEAGVEAVAHGEYAEAAAARACSGDSPSGDGGDDGVFDLILTAETCYTEKVCGEVAAVLAALLKRGRGVALVAAKRFYFGTGGGAACFRRDAERLGLAVAVVAVDDDGRSNIREVMEVRRPAA